MLMLHDGTAGYKNLAPDLKRSDLPDGVSWVDIIDGTSEERDYIERVIGRHLPSLAELNEIETSSRLRYDHGVFCLSATVVSNIPLGLPKTSPVGFIVTKGLLVTIRFEPLTAFSTFEADYVGCEPAYMGGYGAFVGLINAIVDRAADVLEVVGAELDQISQTVFSSTAQESAQAEKARRRPAKETDGLREMLRRIGYNGDLSSRIRDSLLGIGRIASYVVGMGADHFSAELRAHLEAHHRDITSLADYDVHLMNKVQLLLDATMGMINIEQNSIIKALTVVSVVGVPPTLVASMYGMNFHNMPELSWAWGYPYGLALIAISAIGPLVWFKIRGWL